MGREFEEDLGGGDMIAVLDEVDLMDTPGLGINASLAVELTRVEMDQQVVTARRFPRTIRKVAENIRALATLDLTTADECMYALPRGNRPIQGPSIRFAEIVQSMFGNNRASSRLVEIRKEDKVVVAEGVFFDLEANVGRRSEVQRRIVDSQGRLYSDDMIIVTGNAACSIAIRNAILAGVPKAIWRPAYDAVKFAVAGDITTLAETRVKAIEALAHFGVTPEQIYPALGVATLKDIKLDHIPLLRGMFSSLKGGEQTVEELFPRRAAPQQSVRANLDKAKTKDADKEGFTANNKPKGGKKAPAVDAKPEQLQGGSIPPEEGQSASAAATVVEGGGDTAAPPDPPPAEDEQDDGRPAPRLVMTPGGHLFEDHVEFRDAAPEALDRLETSAQLEDLMVRWKGELDRLRKADLKGYQTVVQHKNLVRDTLKARGR